MESVKRAMGVLNEFDPAGLGPGEPDGPPDDEHISEALTPMNRLADFDELTDGEVRALFDRQFWPGLVDEAESRAIAARLTALHRQPRSG